MRYANANTPYWNVSVKYGSDLLFNPSLRQQVLGVTEIAKNVIGMTVDTVIDLADQLTPPREVVTFEVTNDINAFEEYRLFWFSCVNFCYELKQANSLSRRCSKLVNP